MIGASVLFIALSFAGPFYIWHGIVLLAGITVFLSLAFVKAHQSRQLQKAMEQELGDPHMEWWKIGAFTFVGLAGLPLGANLLVDGAVNIAEEFGVDDGVIGLTLVAVGTSLPELATSVMAALRRQADVAIGNVVGSNIFNLLGIMGVASFFGPLPVPQGFLHLDLWIMLGTSLLMAPFVLSYLNIGRAWGLVFITCYATYVMILLK